MPRVKTEGFGHVMNNFNSETSLKFLHCSIITLYIYSTVGKPVLSKVNLEWILGNV